MSASKSAKSGHLPCGKLIAEREKAATEIRECKTVGYTPIYCVLNDRPIEEAAQMKPIDLTPSDYATLRQHGLTKQGIKRLYGFTNDAAFYARLKALGVYPELPDTVPVQQASEPNQATPDSVPKDQISVPILEETVPKTPESVQPFQPISTIGIPRVGIVLKYGCPICGVTYNNLEDATACLDGHAQVVGVVDIDGHSEVYDCPSILTARLSDGRNAVYHLDRVELGGMT